MTEQLSSGSLPCSSSCARDGIASHGGALRGLADGGAQAEQLRIGHERRGGTLGKRCKGGDKGGTRRGTNANLRLTAEVGHREPSAIELPKPDVGLDPELTGPEMGIRADELWPLIHARIVRARCDTSSVANVAPFA